jgi:hypothetical protein
MSISLISGSPIGDGLADGEQAIAGRDATALNATTYSALSHPSWDTLLHGEDGGKVTGIGA